MSKAKFNTGPIVCTDSVSRLSEENSEFAAFVSESMRKHISGDWGDLDEDDKRSNDESLNIHNRLFSSYNFQQIPGVYQIYGVRDTKIWIITEWDRSVTTVLFPSEY